MHCNNRCSVSDEYLNKLTKKCYIEVVAREIVG